MNTDPDSTPVFNLISINNRPAQSNFSAEIAEGIFTEGKQESQIPDSAALPAFDSVFTLR